MAEQSVAAPDTGQRVTALHEQIAAALGEQISRMTPGQQVLPESQLMATFGASRSTIRRALQRLADEGLLVKRQGKGTFVAEQRLVHPLDRLRPFVSIFTAVGQHPEGRLRAYQWVEASDELPDALARLGCGALLVRRVYYVDGVAKALAEIFLPDSVGRRITREAIEEHPVYQVLDELGIVLHHAEMIVRSHAAAADDAQELGLPPGSPLLVLERTTFDNDQHIVECARYYLPAQTFELRLNVQAQQPESVSYSFSQSGADLVLISSREGE